MLRYEISYIDTQQRELIGKVQPRESWSITTKRKAGQSLPRGKKRSPDKLAGLRSISSSKEETIL